METKTVGKIRVENGVVEVGGLSWSAPVGQPIFRDGDHDLKIVFADDGEIARIEIVFIEDADSKPYPVYSLTREAVRWAGYDPSYLTDEEMDRLSLLVAKEIDGYQGDYVEAAIGELEREIGKAIPEYDQDEETIDPAFPITRAVHDPRTGWGLRYNSDQPEDRKSHLPLGNPVELRGPEKEDRPPATWEHRGDGEVTITLGGKKREVPPSPVRPPMNPDVKCCLCGFTRKSDSKAQRTFTITQFKSSYSPRLLPVEMEIVKDLFDKGNRGFVICKDRHACKTRRKAKA